LDRLTCDLAESCDPIVDELLTTNIEPGIGGSEADVWLLGVSDGESPDSTSAEGERHTLEKPKKSHVIPPFGRRGHGMSRARPSVRLMPHES
jgi:hypothetical protein